MARLKLPDGVSAVGHGQHNFSDEDEDGIVDTGDAPAHVVAALLAHAGCREATDDDVEKADEAAIGVDVVAKVASTKSEIVAELKNRGLKVDGRATIRALAKQLEADDAARAAAEAAKPPPAPPPPASPAPTPAAEKPPEKTEETTSAAKEEPKA